MIGVIVVAKRNGVVAVIDTGGAAEVRRERLLASIGRLEMELLEAELSQDRAREAYISALHRGEPMEWPGSGESRLESIRCRLEADRMALSRIDADLAASARAVAEAELARKRGEIEDLDRSMLLANYRVMYEALERQDRREGLVRSYGVSRDVEAPRFFLSGPLGVGPVYLTTGHLMQEHERLSRHPLHPLSGTEHEQFRNPIHDHRTESEIRMDSEQVHIRIAPERAYESVVVPKRAPTNRFSFR